MYRVYCDGTLICDSCVSELAIINPVIKKEENKAGSFTFIMPPTHPYFDIIERRKSEITVYRGNKLIFSGECVAEKTDFIKKKEFTCRGELAYMQNSIQRTCKYSGLPAVVLQLMLNEHNVQVEDKKRFYLGNVSCTEAVAVESQNETTWKCLEKLSKQCGGILKVRHENGFKFIDMLLEDEKIGNQVIQLGLNMLELTSDVDSSDMVTAVIPLGKELETTAQEKHLTIASVNDGKDYLVNENAREIYGWICKPVYAEEIDNAQQLMEYGERYLQDYQFENLVIEAKAVDLAINEAEMDQFDVSDNIKVISKPHGLNKYFRLTKLTINLNDEKSSVITLGKKEKYSLVNQSRIMNQQIREKVSGDGIITAINNSSGMEKINQSKYEEATELLSHGESTMLEIKDGKITFSNGMDEAEFVMEKLLKMSGIETISCNSVDIKGTEIADVEWILLDGRYVLSKKEGETV